MFVAPWWRNIRWDVMFAQSPQQYHPLLLTVPSLPRFVCTMPHQYHYFSRGKMLVFLMFWKNVICAMARHRSWNLWYWVFSAECICKLTNIRLAGVFFPRELGGIEQKLFLTLPFAIYSLPTCKDQMRSLEKFEMTCQSRPQRRSKQCEKIDCSAQSFYEIVS